MSAVFSIRQLNFTYPEQKNRVLSDLSFDINKGDFTVLCGPSGCGKSTLLRQLKTVLAPHGNLEGQILFMGKPLAEVEQRQQSAKIGFVQQSPDNQIVTDKVWHEMAFGLESLGYDTPTIRARVAEMASFFGIQNWFYKDVTELSGGQKQLLNLASIMAMQPELLILDEPTSQLDPIAASDFLATVAKINRELGTTVLITEHRLEEVFPYASRVLVMDKGRLIADGSAKEIGLKLKDAGHSMFLAMPTAMRIWAAVENDLPCPVSVAEGKNWLGQMVKERGLAGGALGADECGRGSAQSIDSAKVQTIKKSAVSGDIAIELNDVWFKYEKSLPDVVKGLSLKVEKGSLYALLGGNGTGKTTSLGIIGGLKKAYRGDVVVHGKTVILPQNPQTLFVKKTVREDLLEILKERKLSEDVKTEKISRVVALCRLTELLDRHPYDLSGGEQQRAALAKVLLLDPEILLLDEPTKGLDAEFKQIFAAILKSLKESGVTIFMVSHDIEFCAEYADRCALFFDGNVVSEGSPREFFCGNSFYTSSANRMAREYIPSAVIAADVIKSLGGQLPKKPDLDFKYQPLPDPPEDSSNAKPAKLPLWRKVLAVVSGLGALGIFISALGVADLSEIVNAGGLGVGSTKQLVQTALFVVCLLIFAFSVSRKSKRTDYVLQQPVEKRKLTKRTLIATILILLCIPLTLFIGIYYLDGRKYYFISLLILLETMLPFFMIFEGRKPQARELIIIAVICAIGVAGRAAFFMLPNFKPVLAITIIAGVAFGGETGFLVGAVTMLVSNMMFSQGPWTPWQMFSAGIIGFIAGVLFRKGLISRSRLSLCVYGALATIIIYGGIMNPSSALMWAHTINWKILMTYYVTGFPMDCVHAASTWIFLWFAAEPMLEKLDRIKVKYGLVQ